MHGEVGTSAVAKPYCPIFLSNSALDISFLLDASSAAALVPADAPQPMRSCVLLSVPKDSRILAPLAFVRTNPKWRRHTTRVRLLLSRVMSAGETSKEATKSF